MASAKRPLDDGLGGVEGMEGVGKLLEMYELCVQSPRHVVALLRGIHGEEPVALREDFCGSAGVAARWVEEGRGADGGGVSGQRALAIDFDEATVRYAAERHGAVVRGLGGAVSGGGRGGLELMVGDCVAAGDCEGTDVVWVGNFSIGYIHRRSELVAYLRRSKARLDAGNGGFGGGVFACDMYGGAGAYRLGGLHRKRAGRGHEMIHYYWSHDAADPLTGMVENSISFAVEVEGEVVREYGNAFVYRWRLWSLAELGEAMREAGFTTIGIYSDLNIAPGEPAVPVAVGNALPEDYIVVVAAR